MDVLSDGRGVEGTIGRCSRLIGAGENEGRAPGSDLLGS